MFRNRTLKMGTAVTVLASFFWTVCGGQAWAEARTAQNDPARFLLRMAEDPRLQLSAEERGYLRRAAERIETGARREPVRPVPVAPDPAAEMHEVARQLGALATRPASADIAEMPAAVADLKVRLQEIHQRTLAEFTDTGARLRAAHLPQVILDRHEAARADYLKNIETVFRDMDAAAAGAGDPGKERKAIEAAAGLLGRSTTERPHQTLDPSRLPFRAAKPVARKPALPQDGGPIKLLRAAAAAPPTPADLAETPDVQITPEVRALAASLGNQPLKIYEWVRNNIELVPTYGSVQGSRLTLIAKRGNAFDTASLLIALLRAANVPARYVTGTVEVPVDQMESWLGGAETPRVAQQILGQGGVPNVGLLSGGTITHIRMDHVWVEALVDYIPSRGTVQREGDTWVPLDASFKLHTVRPVSDLVAAHSVETVVQPGDHLFDVDESLGKITNVDDSILSSRLESWSDETGEYIRTHGIEQSVLGLLGGATIVAESSKAFAGSLPYEVIARQTAVSALPASLRHSVQLKGFSSDLFGGFGTPAFSVELGLPALNSQRLGIRFEPATQADADTLAAARNGGASSLPVYLVNVVPVIRLDGAELGRGAPVRMGSSYSIDVVFRGPDGPTTIPYRVVAGDEIVAGITGNGVTREVVEERFAGNPVDNAPEYLHQVALHYWAECDYVGNITARPLGVHVLRLPSVGFFSSPLTVSYLFGFPRSGVYESRIMDVKQSLVGAAGTDPVKVVSFMKQSGLSGSYLEGAVFDQLEDRSLPASKGISAVHLISDATDLEIPIYRITQANSAAALPLLQLSSAVESDIRTAVSQGKTVLVPEREITDGPWRGVGYIIQDETTGAGAYMIAGGANGGGLLDCVRELVPRWVLVLLIALLIILLLILLILLLGELAPVLVPALVFAAATAGPRATEALESEGPAAREFTGFLLMSRGLQLLSLG